MLATEFWRVATYHHGELRLSFWFLAFLWVAVLSRVR